MVGFGGTSAAAVTAALTPTFYPAAPDTGTFVLSQLGLRVGTSVAASTGGIAIYSIVYSGAGTFTATLVAQLNAAIATTSAGVKKADCTTGAVGSGASTYTFDFVNNQYIVGIMASTVTTLTLHGAAGQAGLGMLLLTTAARSTVTDWPTTITDAAGAGTVHAGAISASNDRIHQAFLVNAAGKNWL
jgi:hypothetical protein